jgi:acyl carrier protein
MTKNAYDPVANITAGFAQLFREFGSYLPPLEGDKIRGVAEGLVEVLTEALALDDTDNLSPEATISGSLGAESIDLLDILFRFEKYFSIKMPPSESSRLYTAHSCLPREDNSAESSVRVMLTYDRQGVTAVAGKDAKEPCVMDLMVNLCGAVHGDQRWVDLIGKSQEALAAYKTRREAGKK